MFKQYEFKFPLKAFEFIVEDSFVKIKGNTIFSLEEGDNKLWIAPNAVFEGLKCIEEKNGSMTIEQLAQQPH